MHPIRSLRPVLVTLLLVSGVPCTAPAAEPDLEALAQCLADRDAVFYGAHWCPFCRKQKEAFGRHASRLPYVECYDGDRKAGMNRLCKEADVQGFPTWDFEDAPRLRGLIEPERLAAAAGCDGA